MNQIIDVFLFPFQFRYSRKIYISTYNYLDVYLMDCNDSFVFNFLSY